MPEPVALAGGSLAVGSPVDLLLDWYAANRRVLPWREEPTPYRTLVSEFMLQQTRVETAIPYFHAFMERFPSVEALAAAEIQEVLGQWSGLGYYSRARNLHETARRVTCAGAFPATREGLRDLPGVGPYMAAAVGSIAFGLDEVAVDGNVRRVICRFRGLVMDPTTSAGSRVLEATALSLLPSGRASEFNQALMDLGARICLPRGPRCTACPWQEGCLAHASGTEEELPVRRKARHPRPTPAVAGVWEREGALLLAQRPPTGLLGGLWELPGGRLQAGEESVTGLRRLWRERLGLHVEVSDHLGSVEHVFTHLRWVSQIYRVEGEGEPSSMHYPAWRMVAPGHASSLPLSRLAEKTLECLKDSRDRGAAPGPPETPQASRARFLRNSAGPLEPDSPG